MWVSALILGFAGSLHCVGMCSPLAMAVTMNRPSAILNRLIYNAGRILTYGLLGMLIAAIGMTLPLRNFQNITSICLGLFLLLIGLGGIRTVHIPFITPLLQTVTNFLKKAFAGHLRQKTSMSVFILGTLNGLLPCGLTFIALTWCLSLAGPIDGLFFMLLFGMGTLPVMLGVTALIPLFVKKFNWNVQGLASSMMIISGIILIARVFFVHLPHAPSGNSVMEVIMCR